MSDDGFDPLVSLVKRRMEANPTFRERIVRMVGHYVGKPATPPADPIFDYLDRTIESPQFRAILDEAKRKDAAR